LSSRPGVLLRVRRKYGLTPTARPQLDRMQNVILLNLWWNPALEDQAFDRAHRLGQTRDVNRYRLTIENTVEERILALQNSKRAFTAAALSGDRLKNLKLGLEDLMALFRPGREEYED